MNKIQRLRWLGETFGREFVSPYQVCRTLEQLILAIDVFRLRFPFVGIRTERAGGGFGYELPFLFPATTEGAVKLWEAHGDRLLYIVSRGILPVRMQGVALRISPEHVLFEINDREPMIAQRHMYRHPENLRRIVLGPPGAVPWSGMTWTSWSPECGFPGRLDDVYGSLMRSGVDEITFTVTPEGELVFW